MHAVRRVCIGSRLQILTSQAHIRTLTISPFQPAERPAKQAPRATYVLQARRGVSAEATARELSQQSVDELAEGVDEDNVAQAKDKQHKRPWMREGVDHAPVRRQRSAGAMTKGESPGLIMHVRSLRKPRQAAYNALTPPQVGHALDNGRHQHR